MCLICFAQEEEVLRGRGLLVTGKMLSNIWGTGLGPQPHQEIAWDQGWVGIKTVGMKTWLFFHHQTWGLKMGCMCDL